MTLTSRLSSALVLTSLILVAGPWGCVSAPTKGAAPANAGNSAVRSAASTAAVPAPEAAETGPLLSKVLQDKLTGEAETPEQRAELIRLRDQFVEARGALHGSVGPAKAKALRAAEVAACEDAAGGENPFCPAVELELKPGGRRAALPPAVRHHRRARPSAQLLRDLRAARIEKLAEADEATLRAALHHVRDVSGFKPLITRALTTPEECLPTALLTQLGSRLEEELPDPDSQRDAEALYAKSASCGTDASAIRAAYRLGLFRVGEGKAAEATELLRKVAESPEGLEFRSRAYYWLSICAKRLGRAELEVAERANLIREYPFSLHALLADEGKSIVEPPIVNETEPHVRFRSDSKPDLNPAIAAAESLQALDLMDSSVEVLEPMLDGERLHAAEPSFQLYVAVLLMRSGDTIRKFQLLTGAFHDHPRLISKATLEMLYPLKEYEIVRNHGDLVDPFLVLALIRQESAFNVRARSRANARGLMQLLPTTARRIERKVSKGQLYDPEVNVRVGTKYFAKLIDRYGGEAELALAAYNAGAEKVDEWLRRYPTDDRLLFLDLVPFRETREYVASIARNYYWYLRLYEANRLRKRVLEQQSALRHPASTDHGLALFKLGRTRKF